jgi:hypothetical protein
MGQTKFKYLNRSGFSIYWNNSWESKNNFKKNFVNFYFLDLFLNKFFNEKIFLKDYFYKKNKLLNFNKNFFYKNILYFKKKNILKKKFKNLKIFNSKLWIFKYQSWIILKMYIYKTKYNSINNIRKKKIILKRRKYNCYFKKFNFL